MDTDNRLNAEDYLFYDLSELGIEPKSFAISIDVAGTSLMRSATAIEDIETSGSSPTTHEKGAFLWAMEDGYSLYLKTSEHPENPYTPNKLVLLSQTGGQIAVASVNYGEIF